MSAQHTHGTDCEILANNRRSARQISREPSQYTNQDVSTIACCTSRRNRSRVRYVRRTAGIRSYTNHSSMREVHVIFCITEVSKAAVRTMVRYYEAYQSIDPAIDAVWIKYPHGRYTTQFKKGNVTGPQLVLVNGIPRHIKDLRPCHGSFSSKDDRSDVI